MANSSDSVQGCGISSVSVLELPQPCSKPLIYDKKKWYSPWMSNLMQDYGLFITHALGIGQSCTMPLIYDQ